MSTNEASPRPWKLLVRRTPTETGSTGRGLLHENAGSAECPVCRKPHGAQLVRPIPVVRSDPELSRTGSSEVVSKYYPPPVPVLSEGSNGPISRTTKWSLKMPEREGAQR